MSKALVLGTAVLAFTANAASAQVYVTPGYGYGYGYAAPAYTAAPPPVYAAPPVYAVPAPLYGYLPPPFPYDYMPGGREWMIEKGGN
jgi:hypothetical protein